MEAGIRRLQFLCLAPVLGGAGIFREIAAGLKINTKFDTRALGSLLKGTTPETILDWKAYKDISTGPGPSSRSFEIIAAKFRTQPPKSWEKGHTSGSSDSLFSIFKPNGTVISSKVSKLSAELYYPKWRASSLISNVSSEKLITAAKCPLIRYKLIEWSLRDTESLLIMLEKIYDYEGNDAEARKLYCEIINISAKLAGKLDESAEWIIDR